MRASSFCVSARLAALATPAPARKIPMTASRMRAGSSDAGCGQEFQESLRNESVERYAGGGRFHLSPQAREVRGQVIGRLDGPAGARAGRTPPAGAARVAALLFGPADLAPPAGGLRAGGQVREL